MTAKEKAIEVAKSLRSAGGLSQEEFDTLNCLLRRLLENCGQLQEEHPCKALAAVSKIMYSGGTV